MKFYELKRVLNNNAVIASAGETDYLLLGLSIGYRRHAGESVPGSAVERFYVLSDAGIYQRLEELYRKIPDDIISFSMELVTLIKSSMGTRLSDNLYISLPDHIASSLELYRQGIHVDNMMLWDIKSFFVKEFELGLIVVEAVNKRYGVAMGEDEAAFIALHIINASYDAPNAVAMEITRFVTLIVREVESLLGMTLDRDSLSFFRFVTHLKYLGRRVIAGERRERDDMGSADLLAMLDQAYPRAVAGADRICVVIERDYGYEADASDRLYLTIHVQQLIDSVFT